MTLGGEDLLLHEKLTTQAQMSDIERTIADYFLNQPESLQQISARKLSEILYVAPSTITRFCKKIGYSGFNEFKNAYLEEYNYLQAHFKEVDPNHPFLPNDSTWSIANKIGQLYSETVLDTLAVQSYERLEQAAALINHSRTIYIYSGGKHIHLANYFKNKMLEIGKHVEVIQRFDLVFYHVGYASNEDCLILISYSGETNDITRILKGTQQKNLPILA